MKIKLYLYFLLCAFLFSNNINCQTQDIQDKISKMIIKHKAIENWEYSLTNGAIREWTTIKVSEIESLWLSDKPIFYYGHIMESMEYSDTDYLLLIDRNPFVDFKYFYYPEVRLSLIIPKIMFDNFLVQHPDFYGEYGFNNSFALIAKIDSISAMTELDEDGNDYNVLMGHGRLLDITYIGFIAF